MNTRFPPVLALLAVGACGNTDPAVFVEAKIVLPAAAVSVETFGTGLTGSFQLSLHLSARASDTSQVGVESFAIVSADQKTEIVAPLQAAATGVTFPVSVEQDSDEVLSFTFDTTGKLLPAEKKAELCGAGGLRIKVVMNDSLQGGATPVVSETFQPSGC